MCYKAGLMACILFGAVSVKDALCQCAGALWSENFSYADGTVVGANNNTTNPSPDWTSGGCTTCNGVSDTWDVRSNQFQAHDVNDHDSWLLTEAIAIAGFTTVDFCITISETGDHEGLYMNADDCGDISNQDYVDVEYRIDGGGWILVQNYLGWCGLYGSCANHTFYGDDGLTQGDCRNNDTDWGSSTVTVTGLTGTTLQLRITARNSAASEYINIDNINVNGNVPLPIELSTFNAERNGDEVRLTWETYSETNNDYFLVERSVDGVEFSEIDWVDGAGTSVSFNSYQVTDFDPIKGLSFYRLKQVDFDGSQGYSHIKAVKFDDPIGIQIERIFYSEGRLEMHLTEKSISEYLFTVTGVNGQKVIELTGVGQSLSATRQHLPSGLYIASVFNNFDHHSIKFVVP